MTSSTHAFAFRPALLRRASLGMALLAGAAALSGCRSLSPDGGLSLVSGVAHAEVGKDVVAIRTTEDAALARSKVAALLGRPLSADSAVQIALLNNRGLQAAYNELGIAETIMVEASRPAAPTISLERLASASELEIERRIVANILALLTLPKRSKIAADRFQKAQFEAAEETLRLAIETRRAYYRTVGSRQIVLALQDGQSSAQTASELLRRLGETGAVNKLDQARQQAFYAELTAQLATARERATRERERLIRAMGLWGQELAFQLPDTLPALPNRPRALPNIEQEALVRRVDLQAALLDVKALGKSYGLTRKTKLIDALELAGIAKKTRDEEGNWDREYGFEFELQVPIFDLGKTRLRKAEQTYLQALNRLAEKAVNVRSEARSAYRGYRSTYDIAAHYEREVLPLRQIISDETLLHYNAMLMDVLDLLADARQRIASRVAAIEAKREFWLATADLQAAISGGGSAGDSVSAGAMASAQAESGGH